MMKFYWVGALFIVLVRYPVHKPVRTIMYGLISANQIKEFISYINQPTIKFS